MVALTAEALAVGGLPVVTGVGPRRAARTARRHLSRRPPDVVINLGLAGGLDPTLQAGDIVLVERWIDGAQADQAWSDELAGRLRLGGLDLVRGPALTVPKPLWRPAQKWAAGEDSGATICEMEGAPIAAACAAAGVPVAAVRVVLDPVERELQRLPGPFPEFPVALAALRRVGRALRRH
jgi:nucleoside phosphorylase